MIGYDPRISAQMAGWKDSLTAGGIRVAGCDLCRMRNESRISKMRTKVSGRSRSPHRQDRVTRAQGCEQARASGRLAHGSDWIGMKIPGTSAGSCPAAPYGR